MGRSVRPEWYLHVAPRIHNVWDEYKRHAIVTLRDGGTSPDLIARSFATTTTIIHNQTRIGRCFLRNICYQCRRPLKTKRTRKPRLCPTCRKENNVYKKGLRDDAQAQGMCIACEDKKALKGHKYCRRCISATYRRRIKEGLCGICGKKPINKDRSKSMCTKCLNNSRKQKREARSKHGKSKN